jgi:TonB family protein
MKNKLQIMKNRPYVTDEEIRGYMNFDSVVNQHKAQKKSQQNRFRNATIFLGIASIAVLVYVSMPDEPASTNTDDQSSELVVSNDMAQVPKKPSPYVSEGRQDDMPAGNINKTVEAKPTEKKKENVQKTKPELSATEIQYQEAEPTEGYPHLYEYFATELRYPSEVLKDSIQGIVSVSFLIDQQGKPVQIKILNSLGPAFDKEAVRLIENMPAWKPATLNGKPVSAKISLPFTFQIVSANPEKK